MSVIRVHPTFPAVRYDSTCDRATVIDEINNASGYTVATPGPGTSIHVDMIYSASALLDIGGCVVWLFGSADHIHFHNEDLGPPTVVTASQFTSTLTIKE